MIRGEGNTDHRAKDRSGPRVRDERTYAELLKFFNAYRGHLSKQFTNLVADLEGRMPLDAARLAAAAKTAAAGEYLYFDAVGFLLTAEQRLETTVAAELLYDLSRIELTYARILVERYYSAPLNLAVHADRYRKLAHALAPHGSRTALFFSMTIAAPGEEERVLLSRSFRAIAEGAPGVLDTVARVLSEQRALLPPRILHRWLARGAALVESGRTEEAFAFLRFQSRESRSLLGLSYAVLADLRNVLGIYAASISGRNLAVTDGAMSPYGIERPYTDATTVFLPGRVALFRSEAWNERAYSALAALAAGQIAFGSFGLDLEGLDVVTELREQYGTVLPDLMEAVRRRWRRRPERIRERTTGEVDLIFARGHALTLFRTRHEEFFFLFPTPELAAELFSIVEGVRIETLLRERYPGLATDLGVVNRALLERRSERIDPLLERLVATGGDLMDELRIAIEGLIQHALGGDHLFRGRNQRVDARIDALAAPLRRLRSPGAGRAGSGESTAALPAGDQSDGTPGPGAGSSIDASAGVASAGAAFAGAASARGPSDGTPGPGARPSGAGSAENRAGPNVADSARVTAAIYAELYDHYPVVPFSAEYAAEELFTGLSKPIVSPEAAFHAAPELFSEKPERPSYAYDLEEGVEREVDLTSLSRHEAHLQQVRDTILFSNPDIYTYPEFNIETGAYRRRHCTLYESFLPPGSPERYRDALRTHELTYRRIRKRFLSLQPEELALSRRWYDGDEIHISDAVDAAVDRRRGATPTEKVYIRRRRNRRDIVAAVLLDASSSTEEPVGEQRVIDIERDALSLLGSALETAGDRFGLFTFFSMGRSNVFCNVVKDFSERWNAETQGRISSIRANAGNRDGCAIRHLTSRLRERSEKTRLLLLLSDGIPADNGYGTARGVETNRYAIEDTRRAILEARRAGIVVYCITIDRHGRTYLPYLYGQARYSVVPDVARLPERMTRLYARITT